MNFELLQPNVTAWTPYFLSQFLTGVENVCDLSCFRYIAIGGSSIEKPLVDKFRVSYSSIAINTKIFKVSMGGQDNS